MAKLALRRRDREARAEFVWQPRKRREPTPRLEVRRFAGPRSFVEGLSRPLRVAHLTDQHVGLITPMRVQMAAIDAANAAQPDLVAITGDFVCHSQAYLGALRYLLDAIEAPVVGVLGNHDHWAGAREVRVTLRRAGVVVLDNASTVLRLGGQELQVVGLDDAHTGQADLRKALRGMRPDLPTIGLSHIPEEADGLWAGGVPLVFSGHTHAGQVTVARLNELTLGRVGGHRYVHGLYGSRTEPAPRGAVYVGAGIGSAVVPVRMGSRARREVALFELGVEPGQIDEHHTEQEALPGRPVSNRRKARRAAKVIRLSTRRTR